MNNQDKWEMFVHAVITVIGIIIVAGLVFKPDNSSDVRHVTYLSFAVVVIIVTIVSDFEYKKVWTWENRMENAGVGIFISFFLDGLMNSYSVPGGYTYMEDYQQQAYGYVDEAGLQSIFYIIILLMVVYFYLNYSIFWEHKGYGSENMQERVDMQKYRDLARQNLPRPNPSTIYYVKEIPVRSIDSFAIQIYGKPFDQLTSDQKEKLKK
jgi:hypothetical protein